MYGRAPPQPDQCSTAAYHSFFTGFAFSANLTTKFSNVGFFFAYVVFCCVLKVDSVIDICSEVMNLRSVSYECKKKLEEIKDDYKIEVRLNVKLHI